MLYMALFGWLYGIHAVMSLCGIIPYIPHHYTTTTSKTSNPKNMKLVTISQMITIEKQADASGVSYAEMMQNAGVGLAKIIHQLGEENHWHTITGLVGSGNNGGDTLVALTWLAQEGWWTRAYLVNRKHEDELIKKYLEAGGEVKNFPDFESLQVLLNESNVLLDGLLGTGIKLPLRQEVARVLHQINLIIHEMNPPPFVVAVVCPKALIR